MNDTKRLQFVFGTAAVDVIVLFDADGSTDPKEFPDLVEDLVCSADFADGSRNDAEKLLLSYSNTVPLMTAITL